MPKGNLVFAAALPVLLLAACSAEVPATAENEVGAAGSNALENASPSDPGRTNVSDQPDADPVRPPDAVSHPDGYLPPAGDLPANSTEPPNGSPPGAKAPATEDEYIRNRQAGS